VLVELDRHPHARAVLTPALPPSGAPSHAYLFYGPGGSGKRTVAREVAAALLADGAPDPEGARARVAGGAHPDLTWVAPSGAHEILVSDIDKPVIAAASKTPFESSRRVFVIERVDELGDEAANRMLKTLEEPAPFVHLILLTDRLVDVLETIRSRCQLVRFDAPPPAVVADGLQRDLGLDAAEAASCARLSLGDAERARELAGEEGRQLRAAAAVFVGAVLDGTAASQKPWGGLLAAVKVRGEAVRVDLEARGKADLELYPRKERKRVETEWNDRIRRVRRRVETRSLDLGLELVTLTLADLGYLALGAEDLVRNVDRVEELRALGAVELSRLRDGMDLVEETRRRFVLNVSEDLACEALAYRLEQTLAK
jgi:DNA polymerase III subunit delta'